MSTCTAQGFISCKAIVYFDMAARRSVGDLGVLLALPNLSCHSHDSDRWCLVYISRYPRLVLEYFVIYAFDLEAQIHVELLVR